MTHSFRSRARGGRHVRRLEQPFACLLSRLLRRFSVRLERRVQDCRLAVMKREDLGQGHLALAGGRLAPPRGRGVQARSFGARQRPVGDLLDEDVAEGEAVALGWADEIAVDQVFAQRRDLRRLAKLQRGDAGRAERASEDAAELEHAPLFGRKQVETRQDGALDGVGQALERSVLEI